MFGDPHIYTFDDLPYTFNGKGEFVLVRVDSVRHKLDVQGRFEQISPNYMKESKGSMLTAVAGVWGWEYASVGGLRGRVSAFAVAERVDSGRLYQWVGEGR